MSMGVAGAGKYPLLLLARLHHLSTLDDDDDDDDEPARQIISHITSIGREIKRIFAGACIRAQVARI